MNKKFWGRLTAAAAVMLLAGCSPANAQREAEEEKLPVELSVVTTFAGEDINAQNFRNAVRAWEKETGNVVMDISQTSDETFKNKVATDFETGAEPDVLFFFTGSDANSFIRAGKVVPIEEIRKQYPDYGSNMADSKIPGSLVDGRKYALPVLGYWEALFVNTEVLEAAGVDMPGKDYTWTMFLGDCAKIKRAGYTPIACAIGDIPHYWWEFSIFNHTDPVTHNRIPMSIETKNGKAWVRGIEDIRMLYEKGYFPENTLSATDDETFAMFTEGKAAFLLDGSWKVGGITSAYQSDPQDPDTLDEEKLDKISVTFFPSCYETRKTTDLIGGISSGYYISRKAWDDPDKREAAVNFVSYMTSDELVPVFAMHTATALNSAPEVHEIGLNSLQKKAMEMMAECTSLTEAMQDTFLGKCRVPTFDGLPLIVEGTVRAEDAVQKGFDLFYK